MSDSKINGMRVFVIDDSPTIRKSAEVFLKQAGCVVSWAENGYEALGLVKEANPDIILMDIMMPRFDGYQTCMMLKNNPELKSIPIVMLSSKDGLFDHARGQLAGAQEYITKPFTRDELIRVVSSYHKKTS